MPSAQTGSVMPGEISTSGDAGIDVMQVVQDGLAPDFAVGLHRSGNDSILVQRHVGAADVLIVRGKHLTILSANPPAKMHLFSLSGYTKVRSSVLFFFPPQKRYTTRNNCNGVQWDATNAISAKKYLHYTA